MTKQRVLIIHGYNSNANFANALRQQVLNFELLSIDLPKPALPEAWTVEYFALFVREHITKNNLSNLVIVGHSLGAAIVSQLHDLPQILHFVLLSPLHPWATGERSSWLLPKNLSEAEVAYTHLVAPSHVFTGAKLSFAAAHYLAAINQNRPANELLVFKQIQNLTFLQNDLWTAYQAISQRASLIIGDSDEYVLPAPALALAAALKIPAHTVTNCGHAIIFEQPAAVAQLLNEIVSKLSV